MPKSREPFLGNADGVGLELLQGSSDQPVVLGHSLLV